jgi:Mg-chelatase subunit ChlD
MTPLQFNAARGRSLAGAGLALLLVVCSIPIQSPPAHAGAVPDRWPPVWQDAPQSQPAEFGVPSFEPPSAAHCRRAPSTREVPGGGRDDQGALLRRERPVMTPEAGIADDRAALFERESRPVAKSSAPALAAGASADARRDTSAPVRAATDNALPWPQAPGALRQRPPGEAVTAGMVDDNADFGEYLAYRQRSAGLAVRDRDVGERYLLEVVDASGRPVHDAEVALQRPGIAEPVIRARTDTAGRVWLHPRAFLPPQQGETTLGVAVRKAGVQGRGLLVRGQAQAVQVRLAAAAPAARTRLDLVFLIDATGSMDDEIAKLKASMRQMAQQIAQLPGQPDVCYGLVAYRDRGDAFLTHTTDFTDDLAGFQAVLARLQAGGGGDKPEALNEALVETVHRMSWRADAARMVLLVADAAPHLDYGGLQYDTTMQAALAKGIKLFAVGASGLEPEGEYIYRQLSQYTGGRFVFLTYRDATDPSTGPGTQTVHDVKNYSVQTLDQLIVRLVGEELGRLARS